MGEQKDKQQHYTPEEQWHGWLDLPHQISSHSNKHTRKKDFLIKRKKKKGNQKPEKEDNNNNKKVRK